MTVEQVWCHPQTLRQRPVVVQSERVVHCEGVRPGKARVFTCLLAHIESADYSAACREQLGAQQERRVRDWRLDYDLRTACRNDVPKVTFFALMNAYYLAWIHTLRMPVLLVL